MRDTDQRAALGGAVSELFWALDPEDLDELTTRFDGDTARLYAAAVTQAERVLSRLGRGAVAPHEYPHLVAAMLTWGRFRTGVHRGTTNAVAKFELYRHFPEIPADIIVRVNRIGQRDPGFVALLARTVRVLRADPFVGEDPLALTAVVPAVIAAPEWASADDAELVARVRAVRARAWGLTARYRVARRPVPAFGAGRPVLGNPVLLIRLAAYAVAIDELDAAVTSSTDPAAALDELERALRQLVGLLNEAQAAPRRRRDDDDEPDVSELYRAYAAFLGTPPKARGDLWRHSAAGTPGRWARDVFGTLNHRLRLVDGGDWEITVADPPPPKNPDTASPVSSSSHVEHLVEWLVTALFEGAGPAARRPLVTWLTGQRSPDGARNLPQLLSRVAVATQRLDGIPLDPAHRPLGVDDRTFTAMVRRMAARVPAGEVSGHSVVAARLLMLAALPPLWTVRQPAVYLVAAHLRIRIGPGRSGPRKAQIVAAAAVRAPVQFVNPISERVREPCCPDSARSDPSPEPPADAVCRHRPWGETGWVETRGSIADACGMAPDAVRRQLGRYNGPWPELLWGHDGVSRDTGPAWSAR